ncbi:hypothetical protein BH11ACT8_BH11ACT8_01840 [soil metagenome]
MINPPTFEELHGQLSSLVVVLGGSIVGLEASPVGQGRIHLSDRDVAAATRRIAAEMPQRRTTADRLHTVLWNVYESGSATLPNASVAATREVNALLAITVALSLARSHGWSILGGVTVTDYSEALIAGGLTQEQRSEAIRNLCRSGLKPLNIGERTRPDPANGPIIYLGSPISFVDRAAQLHALDIADALEEVIEALGMQADVPGRAIHPGDFAEVDLIARQSVAIAALEVASGFVAIDAQHGKRGMGFSVASVESLGGPVLLMPNELEDFIFARVFGAQFSHREEVVYADPQDAARHVHNFLQDHVSCITTHHQSLLDARERLSDTTQRLRLAFAGVDRAALARLSITEDRVNHLLADPIHLDHARKWEVKAVAKLLGLDYASFAAEIFETRPARSVGERPIKEKSPKPSGKDGFTPSEHEAFRTARQLRKDLDPAKWLVLLDEYMAQVLTEQTAARPRARTDARDWISAYQQRFED